WTGREAQLRPTPACQSPGSRGAAVEQTLMFGIAKGLNLDLPARKARAAGRACLRQGPEDQIEGWMKQWKQGAASINPTWFTEDDRSFSVLQYDAITEDQLRAKGGAPSPRDSVALAILAAGPDFAADELGKAGRSL